MEASDWLEIQSLGGKRLDADPSDCLVLTRQVVICNCFVKFYFYKLFYKSFKRVFIIDCIQAIGLESQSLGRARQSLGCHKEAIGIGREQSTLFLED